MTRIWKEELATSSGSDTNPMWDSHLPAETSPDRRLIPLWMYRVRVCGFTFTFRSVEQIEACLAYFSQKVRPSSRIPPGTDRKGSFDCWEMQSWYDRLPMRLLKDPKRLQVVLALSQAATRFKEERATAPPGTLPSTRSAKSPERQR